MPLLETKGAASAQGFGEFAKVGGPVYIEDVFSTYLYTGDNTQRSIVNGIDLSTKGGMVWLKPRSAGSYNNHTVWDTSRGISKYIIPNATDAQASAIIGATNYGVNGFNTDGFSLGPNWFQENEPNITYASWTFRKQAKFFDVVTYTGNGVARTISHNLGSVPGCIIIKDTSASRNWNVYHRSTGNTQRLLLNDMTAAISGTTEWNSTTPTATAFTVGTSAQVNQSGFTYVAYLFAHDAGGFGLTGSDNVITCGSYTGTGAAGNSITLGYEPQWLLMKAASTISDWELVDTMRGMPVSGTTQYLEANLSAAESSSSVWVTPNATGFTMSGTYLNASAQTYIYIAIRRGPMKVPTDATKVFSPYVTATVAASASGSTSASALYNPGFVTDTGLQVNKTGVDGWYMGARLTATNYLKTETTAAQVSSAAIVWDSNIGAWNNSPGYGLYSFRRSPGFFDVVAASPGGAYTNHNLGVVPELIIGKRRDITQNWVVGNSTIGWDKAMYLNLTNAAGTDSFWGSGTSNPTSTQFYSVAGASIFYLFATCPGVSKVGSYTGTGALQTVNCGFTGGARFVLIKRTDSTGDWWVYDSARGISSGNDPYLFLNAAAAEVTGTNYVDTTSVGFQVTAAAPAGLNANGGTYIFLAIA